MDVPQAISKTVTFNRSKKCFLCSGDFQRRSYIFCAAVVNERAFLTVQKSHRCNQRRTPPAAQNCVAIDKDKAARLRGANDNFLITVPSLDSFSLLVTVLFVAERG